MSRVQPPRSPKRAPAFFLRISEGWSRGPLSCCAVRLRTGGSTGPISKTPNVYAAQDDRTAPHHQEPPPPGPHILELGFWDLVFGISLAAVPWSAQGRYMLRVVTPN